MGPINWLAVILSAFLAIAVGFVWYGPLFGGADLFGRVAPGKDNGAGKAKSTAMIGGIGGAILLQALSALMLGHNYARLGAETLAAKPWLYWMQSGGLAIGFIIPALWISYAHQRISRREALVDAGFWLVVYLASGTVFWVLR